MRTGSIPGLLLCLNRAEEHIDIMGKTGRGATGAPGKKRN